MCARNNLLFFPSSIILRDCPAILASLLNPLVTGEVIYTALDVNEEL